MRKIGLIFAIVIFIAPIVKAQNFSAGENGIIRSRLVLPTAQESLKTLIANGKIPLASVLSCKPLIQNSDNRTILDYLTELIGNQAEGKENLFDYSIELERDKRNNHFWQAKMIFTSKIKDDEAGEREVSGGFRFKMRTQNKSMIRGSLVCIK